MTAPSRLVSAAIDSAAVFSVFERRPSGAAFREAFGRCDHPCMSAGTLAELSILVIARADLGGAMVLDQFLARHAVEIVDVSAATIRAEFRSGFSSYGKGRRSAAGLNYGDLFGYALAKRRDIPLFYQGTDFSATDLRNAMVDLGYPLTRTGEPYIAQT